MIFFVLLDNTFHFWITLTCVCFFWLCFTIHFFHRSLDAMANCFEHHVRSVLNRTDCPAGTNFKPYIMEAFYIGAYVRLQKGCVNEAYWPDSIQNRIGDFEFCDRKFSSIFLKVVLGLYLFLARNDGLPVWFCEKKRLYMMCMLTTGLKATEFPDLVSLDSCFCVCVCIIK